MREGSLKVGHDGGHARLSGIGEGEQRRYESGAHLSQVARAEVVAGGCADVGTTE